MVSNSWFLGIEVGCAASIISAVIQRVWPTPNPNARRLADLERRVRELSARLGIEEAPQTEVQALIAQGRKINAIKLYREQTRVGLKEAKEAVDAMEAQMKASGLA